MLVLTRKTGERIVIGDGVELTVLLVRGQRVRLGINAPSNVPIHRAELAETTEKKQIVDHSEVTAHSHCSG